MPPSTSTNAAIPWVERYRPQTLHQISHQQEVVHALENAIETNRLPHLLFYGKPGTGKTSVALALCKQLWPPSQLKRRVLELNASDERGISVVREKIKHFAGLAVGDVTAAKASGGGGGLFQSKKGGDASTSEKKKKHEHGEGEEHKTYPNPPYKIIILDEADTVTPDAQSALRRIIEANSKMTRFILICNYVTRIIEPLASRCAKFRFAPLPPSSMKARLRTIAQSEGCRFEKEKEGDEEKVMDELLELSQGDMRRAVTFLQSAHSLTGRGDHGVIKAEQLTEMAGIPPPHLMTQLLTSLQSKSFNTMQTTVESVLAEGYAVPLILSRLSAMILCEEGSCSRMKDVEKARLSLKIAEADKCLADGADEGLQLMGVCSLALRCFA